MSTGEMVTIVRARPGREAAHYVEGLVDDDGRRLRTMTFLPRGLRTPWMPPGRTAHRVEKFLFYDEPFGIMRLRDAHDGLICHYCDVLTPLARRDGVYHVQDLFLDLLILADGSVQELDHDELDAAVLEGLVSERVAEDARATLARLRREALAGSFPASHTR